MSRPADLDRDALLRELEALGEQVKLLTRTEQRLHRSQTELDRQLGRIEALAEFSFRASGAEEAAEVGRWVLSLMSDSFDIDGGYVAISALAGGPDLVVSGNLDDSLDPTRILELGDLVQAVRVLDLGASDAEPPAREASLLLPAPGRAAVVVSFRDSAGRLLGALMAWKAVGTDSAYRESLLTAHDAFLYALASHAARAIESASLTRTLRTRTEELSEANQRLRRSLDDLESTQTALLEAQKLEAVSRLAGGVAHDFNNLMTVVLGQIELIAEELPSPPSPETLDEVRTAVARASDLTSQLLDFGRRQPRRPIPTDMPTAVLKTIRAIEPALREDITVSVESSASLPRVVVDQAQLEQVLLNLVLNARDAMPAGGTLKVSARRASLEDMDLVGLDRGVGPASFVALVVSDTGAGMSPEVLQRVFEPFFTTKELGRGTGLGLASVYGVVRQNGGYIGARSTPGSGTDFVTLIPIESASPLEPAPADVDAAHVLLVEDDDGIRGLAGRILQRAGYRVSHARDGVEALSLLARLDPVDIVVSDVIMPRLGGAGLLARVRLDHPQLPVLFVSGHPFEEIDLPALEEGLDHYLPKPFTPRGLRAAVARALARQHTDASGPARS